jgi:hypothetical protein
MQAIRKGQLDTTGVVSQTPAEQFYALAAQITGSDNLARLHPKFATKPMIFTGVSLIFADKELLLFWTSFRSSTPKLSGRLPSEGPLAGRPLE